MKNFIKFCSKVVYLCQYRNLRQNYRKYAKVHSAIQRNASTTSKQSKSKSIDMSRFPAEYIRNFSIIAHVDHGKSTLADRLLELTGTIGRDHEAQVLDKLQVERERGITVKAQTVSLIHEYNGHTYLLNLVDTPGHVDFNYEVSRSLAACQGVILLVDASQGVQAQTVANFYLAFEAELAIIPVLNKLDLKHADPEEVSEQISSLFDINKNEILAVSAKTGQGMEDILPAVIDRIPPPDVDPKAPLQTLLFDSWYDTYKGPVALTAVKQGTITKGDKLKSFHTEKLLEVQELGIMHPEPTPVEALYAGQVGYLYTSLKKADDAQVGDTWHRQGEQVDALPGFKPAVPMVFAGFYPIEGADYDVLNTAMAKLTLNDSSVSIMPDNSAALGRGWRLGFLGLLHMEVFSQRLEQEYGASVLMTSPNVPYRVKLRTNELKKQFGADEATILNPAKLPEHQFIEEYGEPMVKGTIIAPMEYLAQIQSLVMDRRGSDMESTCIDDRRIMFQAKLPLSEVVIDFFDDLKSRTSGYASFDYEECGFEPSELVQIKLLLNDKEVEELSQVSHVTKAKSVARQLVTKLRQEIPRQLYEVRVHAKVGSRVVASEKIAPLKKDVTAKLYGGDVTRRMKLLKKQAEGKKKLKRLGNVNVPKEAFWNILKR